MRIRDITVTYMHRTLGAVDGSTTTYEWRHALSHLVLGGEGIRASARLDAFDYAFRRLGFLGADDVEELQRQIIAFAHSPLARAWARLLRRKGHLIRRAQAPAVAWLQCAAESDDRDVAAAVDAWLQTSAFTEPWLRRVRPAQAAISETMCVIPPNGGKIRAAARGDTESIWVVHEDGLLTAWRLDTGTCRGRWTLPRSDIAFIARLGMGRMLLASTTGVGVWSVRGGSVVDWAALPGETLGLVPVGSDSVQGVLVHQRGMDGRTFWRGWREESNHPSKPARGERLGDTVLVAQVDDASVRLVDLLREVHDVIETGAAVQRVVGVSDRRIAIWTGTRLEFWTRSENAQGWVRERGWDLTASVGGVDRVSDEEVVVWPPADGDVRVLRWDGSERSTKGVWLGRMYKGTYIGTTQSLGHGTLVCRSSSRADTSLRSLHLTSGARSEATLPATFRPFGDVPRVTWPSGPLVEWHDDTVVAWPLAPLGAPEIVPIDGATHVQDLGDRTIAVFTRSGDLHVARLSARPGAGHWGLASTEGDEQSSSVVPVGPWAFVEVGDDCTVVVRSAATGAVVVGVTPGVSMELEAYDLDSLVERFGRHVYGEARGDLVDQALAALPDEVGGPVPRPTRTDVGWLSFHAPTGRSVEWVTERPGAACVQTRGGALHAGEVIALWRGATRADLPAADDPLWTRWAREFADALHLLCGTASVADTAAEPPAIQELARIVRAEFN